MAKAQVVAPVVVVAMVAALVVEIAVARASAANVMTAVANFSRHVPRLAHRRAKAAVVDQAWGNNNLQALPMSPVLRAHQPASRTRCAPVSI